MQIVLSFIVLGLFVFALVDVISRDASQIRTLGKIGWIAIIVLLPVLGALLWLMLGREWGRREEDLDGPPAVESIEPLRTEQELAALEDEIRYYEREAEIRRLEQQLRDRPDGAPA